MNVDYIDHMGSDLHVVNAARVSFDKLSDWEWKEFEEEEDAEAFGVVDYDHYYSDRWEGGYRAKRLSAKDSKLIDYLANHNHWTPFAHCMITLREKVPIFVARQRFKHTVGFSYNEVSRRYVDSEPEFYVPEVWRRRADDKKQGSSEEAVLAIDVTDVFGGTVWSSPEDEYSEFITVALKLYNAMISSGVCPEQARMVLPQSMYTEYIVTGSLAAFARAYNLRSDSHAQKEIQDLASLWDAIIRPLFPHSWSALTNV